jgi:hypothetical protein
VSRIPGRYDPDTLTGTEGLPRKAEAFAGFLLARLFSSLKNQPKVRVKFTFKKNLGTTNTANDDIDTTHSYPRPNSQKGNILQ